MIKKFLSNFFLKPTSAIPLAGLRIGLGLILLLQFFLMRSTVFDLFSSFGFLQGQLMPMLNDKSLPQISLLQDFLRPFGAGEKFCILFVCFSYLLSLIFLTLGWQSRIAATLSWFLHWILMNTASSTTYGVDLYAHVFLFYLIWVPSGAAWSVDAWKKGDLNPVSIGARIGLRILQLHLCLTYLTSGIEKAQGIQWWNGELMWRAVSLPIYQQFDMSWLAHWPALSVMAGWSTLVLELGYCVFIWPKATRWMWILGITGMHVGIMIFLGLHLFGVIMCLLTISLFALPLLKPIDFVAADEQDLVFYQASPNP